VAGGGAATHRQAGLGLGVQVVEMDRIAVDGRVVVGRHVLRRRQVLGQDAAQGRREGDRLVGGHPADPPGQMLERLRRGHESPALSEAVVAELRHG
jgi:hypothetical protein